jgi:Holliday junction resolvase
MSGRRSRDKGARTERAIAKALQANGLAAVKVSRAYQPGHDIVLPLVGRDLYLEVKARADGFRELYGWLEGRDVLIVKVDRQEPLVIVRMSLAAEVANGAVA